MDVLVNNVGGIIARKYLGEIDSRFWQTVINVNMTTMLHVTQALAIISMRSVGLFCRHCSCYFHW